MIAKKLDIRLILDNIRSVHNAGSIFRTAECAGVSKIYCIGTTPASLDRFGRKRRDFAKVALGAEESVAWEHLDEAAKLIKELKKEDYYIIAVEQAENSVDYRKVAEIIPAKLKIAVILGNEVEGINPALLKLADVTAEIPLKGKKESLNVSIAAGVILFRFF